MASGFAHTLEEVGQAFCVTRERIRQIELMALSRVGLGLIKLGVVSQGEVNAARLAKIRSLMGARRRKRVRG
jgi:Sigma-70, region 4